MQNIAHFHTEDAFKVLGDPTCTKILQYLLTKQATISQLGEQLNCHPAKIKYHLNKLVKLGLVELSYILPIKNYFEKYYKTTANAVFLNRAIFPWPSEEGQIVILGGDGPALDYLVEVMNKTLGSPVFCAIPTGSLDSLIYLRENYCQIAGCHLLNFDTGDFNVSYIRHLFAFKEMAIVTFGNRDQGLIVRKGNPQHITDITDVVQKNLIFVNRQLGSGTRLRLDRLLAENSITPDELTGYETEVHTHVAVGEYIQQEKADVGLGLSSIAKQQGLDFHYLFTERYDLVMPKKVFEFAHVSFLIETLRSQNFKDLVENMGGYDLSRAGEVVML